MPTEKSKKTVKKLPIANVICIKWGSGYYDHVFVNRLYNMVKRNIKKHELRFYCFTEITTDLEKGIIAKPLPVMHCDPKEVKWAYLKEAGLCDDALGGLKGQRVLFFDLDMVIAGEIDSLIDYPKGDDFVIINDWNTKGNHVGQASCYSWVVGTLGFVKKDFEKEPWKWTKKFPTASQEYLSYKVIEKFGKLNFWPEKWCLSFKFNLLPPWYLRAFLTPKLPKDCRVLAFHGHPKIDDAITGRWQPNGVPFFKRLYKTIRPVPWLKEYWK